LREQSGVGADGTPRSSVMGVQLLAAGSNSHRSGGTPRGFAMGVLLLAAGSNSHRSGGTTQSLGDGRAITCCRFKQPPGG